MVGRHESDIDLVTWSIKHKFLGKELEFRFQNI